VRWKVEVRFLGASWFIFDFRYNSEVDKIVSNPSNIGVNIKACVENNCQENCHKAECKLCLRCLNDETLQDYNEAYQENSRRGGFKRVFPSKSFSGDEFLKSLTARSKKSVEWFEAKCQSDEKWC
jgi:hypothetical protein